MFQKFRHFLALSAIASIALAPPQAAEASLSINLTDQTGTAATRSFSNISNNLSITFRPSSTSSQNFVSSSSNGLCLYANSADSTGRCGVNGTSSSPSTYNFIEMTANRNIYFTGGFLQQVIGANSQPTDILYSTSVNAPVLASISNVNNSAFSFSPILVSATQSVFFRSSGTNTSTRASSLTFSEVPGPLPILGIAAAFSASRRIRKKIKAAN